MIAEIALPVPIYKTFDYQLPDGFDAEKQPDFTGRRVRIPFGSTSAVGLIRAVKPVSSAPGIQLKTIHEILDKEPVLDSSLLELGEWISLRYACPIGEAFQLLLPPEKKFRGAHPEKGRFEDGMEFAGPHPISQAPMNTDQKRAAEVLHGALFAHSPKNFLLLGNSVYEREAVYLAAMKDALSQGRQILFLTPEIITATRLFELFKNHFGAETVCLWHSDQTPSARMENWWRAARSEASIVVGTRSAALAPLKQLGLVIVDDEQDSAYKEERRPRFHSREVAAQRAGMSSCVLLLGSATPGVGTYQSAMDGEYQLLELPRSSPPPAVQIVDLNAEKRKGVLSAALEKALADRLQRKQKSILFLNRRGFHRAFRCTSCSWTAVCPRCHVVLVPSKPLSRLPESGSASLPLRGRVREREELRCRLCTHSEPSPSICPECGKKKVRSVGYGTERLTAEVKEKFPWCRVVRLDRGLFPKKVTAVKFDDFDILVGTELVTHGFQFPEVSLVCLVDADIPLRIPDYRASETTFQLLISLINQVGQDMVGADVIIQTRNPDHYVFGFAASQDYKGFVSAELRYREELNYPPYSHLVLIRSKDKNEKKSAAEIDRLLNWVAEIDTDKTIGILGPTHVQPARSKGAKILQVLLKVPQVKTLDFLRQLKEYLSAGPLRLWFDSSPESIG